MGTVGPLHGRTPVVPGCEIQPFHEILHIRSRGQGLFITIDGCYVIVLGYAVKVDIGHADFVPVITIRRPPHTQDKCIEQACRSIAEFWPVVPPAAYHPGLVVIGQKDREPAIFRKFSIPTSINLLHRIQVVPPVPGNIDSFKGIGHIEFPAVGIHQHMRILEIPAGAF